MSSDSFDGDMGGRGGRSKRRLNGRKMITFIIVFLLLIGGGVVAARMLGLFGGPKVNFAMPSLSDNANGATASKTANLQTIFYDLPEMLINLRTDQPRPSFLKITVSLEIDRAEDKIVLENVLPRIIDTFQVYLRELHPDQLQGAEGLLRLREELLSRINAAVTPIVVRDVLFKEMLVQ